MARNAVERRIRRLDNPAKPMRQVARDISQRFELSYGTCVEYLWEKRLGFQSHSEYIEAYRNDKRFLKHHVLLPNEELDVVLGPQTSSSELGALLKNLVSTLPNPYRYVIQRRYFARDTLEEVGKDMGICRERVHQLEKVALVKLYRKLNEDGGRI
jgi:RNA polymerase sigma factor (sigma-70 family)